MWFHRKIPKSVRVRDVSVRNRGREVCIAVGNYSSMHNHCWIFFLVNFQTLIPAVLCWFRPEGWLAFIGLGLLAWGFPPLYCHCHTNSSVWLLHAVYWSFVMKPEVKLEQGILKDFAFRSWVANNLWAHMEAACQDQLQMWMRMPAALLRKQIWQKIPGLLDFRWWYQNIFANQVL